MRGADGKILIDGFFDDVRDLTADDRARIAAVDFDEARYLRDLQVDALYGEPGYTALERAWARPTLEVNGIWGGFQGDGVKTVLPNEAHAKITCRLVANQTPAKVADAIEAHVQRVAPPGVRVAAQKLATSAMPYEMPFDHPGNVAAAAVHRKLYGKEPYFVRIGGSLPVVGMFLEALGAYTIDLAFGLDDENIHAPNEFYRLSSPAPRPGGVRAAAARARGPGLTEPLCRAGPARRGPVAQGEAEIGPGASASAASTHARTDAFWTYCPWWRSVSRATRSGAGQASICGTIWSRASTKRSKSACVERWLPIATRRQ